MTTYADSVSTPGQAVGDKCYILAQLPGKTNLDWVRDLRGFLGGGELKFGKFLELKRRVQADGALWSRVLRGTEQATIVVIEDNFYIQAVMLQFLEDGAELGRDVGLNDILRRAAICMIQHAPVMQLQNLFSETHLGLRASRVIKRETEQFNLALSPLPAQADPETILDEIGSKFRDARVFAGRAHALFDFDDFESAGTTNELFQSPYRFMLKKRIAGVEAIFDSEHPQSARVLNSMMAEAVQDSSRAWVSETRSDAHDALQGADFCAGFALDLMMNEVQDREKALRRHFRKVIFNGRTR